VFVRQLIAERGVKATESGKGKAIARNLINEN
jgi:acetyl-CoA carboxylase alpha subunit